MFDTLRLDGDHRAARNLGFARTAPGCWSAVDERPARPLIDLSPGARTAGLAASVVRRLTPPPPPAAEAESPTAEPVDSDPADSDPADSDGAESGSAEQAANRLALLLAARRLAEVPSDAEVLDAAVACDKVISWAAAQRARLLAAFADRRPGDEPMLASGDTPSTGSRWAPDEVGLAMGRSRMTARGLLVQAGILTEVLPDVLTALEAGELDEGKARVLCDLVPLLGPDMAMQVAGRVLPRAGQQSWTQFRAAVRRAILRVDPDGERERHQQARGERRVSVRQVEDGMATLWALLAAAEAAEAWEMLTRLAKGLDFPDDPDPRTLDARRADLLVDLLTGKLTLSTDAATAMPVVPAADPVDPVDLVAADTDSAEADSADAYGSTDAESVGSAAADSAGSMSLIPTR